MIQKSFLHVLHQAVKWSMRTWVVLQYSPQMTRAKGSDNPEASDPISERA